eukprot:GHVO01047902.1.p1 GENE.GHVO01047902.1~~GHVO01047902.1.p1  ORF type:complete len:129 (-),score=15.34 GHVO01047902.1:2-358(-)
MRTFIIFALVAAASAWPNLPNCGDSIYDDAGAPGAIDIVGGYAAREHEFPYQVSLMGSTGSLFCGGSIIGLTQVLTAAHCTAGRSAANTFVGLGAHLLNDPGSEYVRASVTTINQHPS